MTDTRRSTGTFPPPIARCRLAMACYSPVANGLRNQDHITARLVINQTAVIRRGTRDPSDSPVDGS